MESLQKRMLLFLIGCMGTRFMLVWLAYSYPSLLWVMGVLAAVVAMGFFTIYIGGLRTTGAEVFGDKIWWNSLRPVHGTLYMLFAILALSGVHAHAWKVLLVDVVIGLMAFLMHHGLVGK